MGERDKKECKLVNDNYNSFIEVIFHSTVRMDHLYQGRCPLHNETVALYIGLETLNVRTPSLFGSNVALMPE
jgi:hypothetical protein